MKRPSAVTILGKSYSITYVDKPSDVDVRKHESLWGQVDQWTHSIRIYGPAGFENGELWDSLLHEILHVIVEQLRLDFGEKEEDLVGLLALGLSDTLIRNEWLPGLGKED